MLMRQEFKSSTRGQEPVGDKGSYRYILLSAVSIILFGIILMAGGIFARNYPSSASEWFMEAGRTILVTGIMVFFYEFALRHFFLEKTKGVFEETMDSTTMALEAIYERVNLFGKKFEDLEETVVFARKAIESGLVAVHPNRGSAINKIKEKMSTIDDDTDVRLCGISLGDFLLERGKLHKLFLNCLQKKNNFKFSIVMLDPDSEAAKEKARREESYTYRDDCYQATSAYNELIAAHRKAESLKKRYPDKIRLKISNVYPLCFLAIVKDTAFTESYNYAHRGSEVPVLEITRARENHAEHDLFKIYDEHFESLWKKPNQGDEDIEKLCI